MSEHPRRTADGRAIHASAHEAVPGESEPGPGPRPAGGMLPARGRCPGARAVPRPPAATRARGSPVGAPPTSPIPRRRWAPPRRAGRGGAAAASSPSATTSSSGSPPTSRTSGGGRRRSSPTARATRPRTPPGPCSRSSTTCAAPSATRERTATASSSRTGSGWWSRQFEQALATVGVEPVETVGAPFDPAVHEAIGGEESDEVSEDTVIAELQPGYRLHDRLLRPALVRVAHPRRGGEAAAGTEP